MDQMKIGSFLKELRKEKELTQEQLAEKLNVSNRSVSRWETGSTLPDISILIELAEFYDVDIKEIIDGERKSEEMEKNLKEQLITVADYSEKRSNKKLKKVVFIMSALFFVLSVVIIVFFTSHGMQSEVDTYPVYKQVYLNNDSVIKLLNDYVVSNMSDEGYGNSGKFAGIKIFSTEEKSSGHYYVYAWVVESRYSYEAGVLSEINGSSYPCRFEITRENDTFNVLKADIPRDGSYYGEDLDKFFPYYVREQIYDIHEDKNIADVYDDVLDRAKEYYNM